jgi:glycerol uptake facilitator protein
MPKTTVVVEPSLTAQLVAEFLGTMLLVTIGNGVVAMVVLFGHSIPGEIVNGGFTNITLCWGIAVTMGVYLAGKISGGHLNPAVTIAVAAFRGFPWKKVGPYIIAQIAGGFMGAAIVYLNYLPQFNKVDPARDHTAGVFTTFPAFPDLPQAGLLDQTIGTALLLICIMAVTDARNSGVSGRIAPILVGLTVVGVGMSFGSLHGYAINPARDFGPRLLTAVAGFKNNGLTNGPSLFWVPIVGPIIGGLIGVLVYDQGIGRFLKNADTE